MEIVHMADRLLIISCVTIQREHRSVCQFLVQQADGLPERPMLSASLESTWERIGGARGGSIWSFGWRTWALSRMMSRVFVLSCCS